MGTKKSLTNFILLVLEKTVDSCVRLDHFINNSYLYAHYGWWDRPLKKTELARALKRLRERGLIDFMENDQLAYKLTDKGRQKAVWQSVILKDEKWDGKWRLVIFDIRSEERRVGKEC